LGPVYLPGSDAARGVSFVPRGSRRDLAGSGDVYAGEAKADRRFKPDMLKGLRASWQDFARWASRTEGGRRALDAHRRVLAPASARSSTS
jgi:hypothetical protein